MINMIDWRTSTYRERIRWARYNLKPFFTEYRVVYDDIDMKTAAIMVPDQHFMANLMYGGLVPPAWVKLKLREDSEHPDFVDHRDMGNFELLDQTEPLGPLTEEEAIEYLIQTDIPRSIWEDWDQGNFRKIVVCKKNQLPKTREWRDTWRIAV